METLTPSQNTLLTLTSSWSLNSEGSIDWFIYLFYI